MSTLVHAPASRFIGRRLERNGTAGKFLAVSGRLAVRTLLIQMVMTIEITSLWTMAPRAYQASISSRSAGLGYWRRIEGLS